MALTGLQIQKLLPKTNCKECGCSTCLAFAMKLAGKKADLAECPYVSEEAKAILGADAEPPIRTVTVGEGDAAFKTGGETVVFRHEKTFVNQTGIGLYLADTLTDEELATRVKPLADYCLERVGETLRPNMVAVCCASGKAERLVAAMEAVAKVWAGTLCAGSADVAVLKAAAGKFSGKRILLASANRQTVAELAPVAKEHGCVLAISAETFDDLVAAVEMARAADCKDLFLELKADSLSERVQNNTICRRGALKGGVKALGYPLMRFVGTGDPIDDAVEAGIEIAKYGSLVLLPEFDPATFVTLLTMRQNIFTDPQKPIQVEPKIYTVGEPNENSPVFVTTNFSLTYFIVSGEIENSGQSAWLAIPECEGLSVMTAWAAGKFGGDKIGKFIKESGLPEKLAKKRVVIPGYVSQISGELEEALPGWQILVGPQEAGDIEGFVKNVLNA